MPYADTNLLGWTQLMGALGNARRAHDLEERQWETKKPILDANRQAILQQMEMLGQTFPVQLAAARREEEEKRRMVPANRVATLANLLGAGAERVPEYRNTLGEMFNLPTKYDTRDVPEMDYSTQQDTHNAGVDELNTLSGMLVGQNKPGGREKSVAAGTAEGALPSRLAEMSQAQSYAMEQLRAQLANQREIAGMPARSAAPNQQDVNEYYFNMGRSGPLAFMKQLQAHMDDVTQMLAKPETTFNKPKTREKLAELSNTIKIVSMMRDSLSATVPATVDKASVTVGYDRLQQQLNELYKQLWNSVFGNVAPQAQPQAQGFTPIGGPSRAAFDYYNRR